MNLVLLSISGPDRPGLLGDLMGALAGAGIRLVDIQQATLLDLLGLSILVDVGAETDPVGRVDRVLAEVAATLGLTVHARPIDARGADRLRRRELYALTILSQGLDTPTVARLARALASHHANIVTIHRLAEADLSAVDFIIDVSATPDLGHLKSGLLGLSDATGIDLGLQPENAFRKSKRLVVFDVDSTLLAGEAIDELAREAGQSEAAERITRKAMEGEIDFTAALRERVRLLAGLPLSAVERARARLPLTPGAAETIAVLKSLGYRVAAISGGFDVIVQPLKAELSLDYAYCNTLGVAHGHLNGDITGEIIDAGRKAELLRNLAAAERIPIEQVVGIGDGANDVPMLLAAGFGIAFGRRDKPRRAAAGAIQRHDLRGILYLLGVSEKDVRQAENRRQS